jgi:ABC-type iron transport system FetAB permease component
MQLRATWLFTRDVNKRIVVVVVVVAAAVVVGVVTDLFFLVFLHCAGFRFQTAVPGVAY